MRIFHPIQRKHFLWPNVNVVLLDARDKLGKPFSPNVTGIEARETAIRRKVDNGVETVHVPFAPKLPGAAHNATLAHVGTRVLERGRANKL